MVRFSTVLLLLTMLVLAACGGGGQTGGGQPSGGGSGNAERGKTVFESKGCTTCHTLSAATGATGTTGPNLNGIGTRAATRKPNMSAEAYIRESEQNPTAFTVDGFQQGVMPPFQGTAQELNDVVAFLLAQQ